MEIGQDNKQNEINEKKISLDQIYLKESILI